MGKCSLQRGSIYREGSVWKATEYPGRSISVRVLRRYSTCFGGSLQGCPTSNRPPYASELENDRGGPCPQTEAARRIPRQSCLALPSRCCPCSPIAGPAAYAGAPPSPGEIEKRGSTCEHSRAKREIAMHPGFEVVSDHETLNAWSSTRRVRRKIVVAFP